MLPSEDLEKSCLNTGRAEIETAPGELVDRPGTLEGVCGFHLRHLSSEIVVMLE